MLHQSKCEKILRQIIERGRPKRVIVFGSSVNEKKKRARDLDFLIVVPNDTHCREMARELYRNIQRSGISVDFIVITEAEYEWQSEAFWSVVAEARREGKEIYVA